MTLLASFPFGSVAAQDIQPDIGVENQDQQILEDLPTPIVQQPLPMIDSSLAGWNEAGSGFSDVATGIRSNWVMTDSGGSISGTVWGDNANDIADMKIFLLRKGIVVNQTTTTDPGNFKLDALSAGLYTMVGYSPSAIFAFGFNAVNFRESCPNMPRHITIQAISSSGNKIVTSDLISEHSSDVRFPLNGLYAFGEEDVSVASHFGLQGLGQFDVPAIPATTIESHPIALSDGGTFRGRIHQIHNQNGRPIPILQTKLLLIESGTVVGSANCDRHGIFEFTAISPGDYGLVAVGSDGFAALGIRLVGPEFDPQTSTPPLDLTLIQDESVGWLNHFVTEQQFIENIAQPRLVVDSNFGPGYDAPCDFEDCVRVYYGPMPDCSCHR